MSKSSSHFLPLFSDNCSLVTFLIRLTMASPPRMSTSTFVSSFAARASILRMRSHNRFPNWSEMATTLFRTADVNAADPEENGSSDNVVRQVRQTTWPEVTRLLNAGLGGHWSMGVFLVLGFTACHITGPSVVMSVVIAAVTAVLTGKEN